MASNRRRFERYICLAVAPVLISSAETALGDIMYVEVDQTLGSFEDYMISIPGINGYFNMLIGPRGYPHYESYSFRIQISGTNPGGIATNGESNSHFIDRFSKGDLVSYYQVAGFASDFVYGARTNLWSQRGEFTASDGPQSGYAAFGFVDGENAFEPNYGWIFMTWDGMELTLHGYAWETEQGVPIAAGMTTPVPGAPGAVGLVALAAGAAGIRRKRNA